MRIAILCVVVLAVASVSSGIAICGSDNDPVSCDVVYKVEPSSGNTAVLLDCLCAFRRETWYLAFFVGEQPSLWEWYGIQNAAGGLIR